MSNFKKFGQVVSDFEIDHGVDYNKYFVEFINKQSKKIVGVNFKLSSIEFEVQSVSLFNLHSNVKYNYLESMYKIIVEQRDFDKISNIDKRYYYKLERVGVDYEKNVGHIKLYKLNFLEN